MTSPSKVRLGIAGCGNVLGAYLAQAWKLKRKGMAEVVAFCGRPRQSEATLATWPGADFVTEYAALLKREDVDAVAILTPMREHAVMAKAALEAGKHVLVEKPMATNLADARELIELAKRLELLLVCAPFTVLSPTFQTIAQRVRDGAIGKVASARGRYGWAGPDWSEWFYKPGAGALFDLGVYNLTTLTGILGPARRVTAFMGKSVPERLVDGKLVNIETEDNAQVLLDFGDGCLAAMTSSFSIQQYRGPGLELFGTDGTLYMLGDDWDPDGYEMWQNPAGCWQLFKETEPDWPWTDGLRHLVECIGQGTRPQVTPEHALHVLEIMLAAQDAARDGTTRAIDSSFSPPVAAAVQAGSMHRIHDRTRSE